MIYHNGYPTDWSLHCAKTELEAIASICRERALDITVDEFYEQYTIELISCLYVDGDSKQIKQIIFE